MIADTTFLSDLFRERRRGQLGPAHAFLAGQRKQKIRMSIITAGEVLLLFENSATAWRWLAPWTIYRLHFGIVEAAAEIARELIRLGRRLGENDNWIAGFARYYREPLLSRDRGFDAVPGLRRMAYCLPIKESRILSARAPSPGSTTHDKRRRPQFPTPTR